MNPEDLPLRDLHLPAEIGWWPVAPGWWFLAVLLLVGIMYLALRFWRNWRRAAARRVALAEFSRLRTQLDQDGDIPGFVAAVSTLLRRAMLAYGERQHVAGIVGDEWLHALDEGLARPGFQSGIGRCLAELPYRPQPALQTGDLEALTSLVKQRLRTLPRGAR